MSTSLMQAIKQQLEDMPLEEFETLLKGVAVSQGQGHEGLPQHAELLSQLKHHVKVPPDEPIQTKASDKDCRTFLKSLNERDKRRLANSGGGIGGGGGSGNVNGNAEGSGVCHPPYVPLSSRPINFLGMPPARYIPQPSRVGDQNANNPLSSTSFPTMMPAGPPYHHHQQNKVLSKYSDYNNHYLNSNTPSYGYSLGGDPDDDDQDDQEIGGYLGNVPSQYILPADQKMNKDLPMFPQNSGTSLTSCGTSQSGSGAITGSSHSAEIPATSSASWDVQSSATSHLQLNDGYKSVSSVTSGVTSYMGRSVPSSNDGVYGTVRAVSPTLPAIAAPSAILSKSPSLEGSQFDKATTRRPGDRKKKIAKSVYRETVINPADMPGYKGTEQDIDKLLEFVEGNQPKSKKSSKEKKRDPKPKGNEKQILSKAASLDENSLGYGSKKGDDSMSRNRNNKDIENKNSTNITKSSTAICSVEIADSNKSIISSEPAAAQAPPSSDPQPKNATPTPLVNGTAPISYRNIAAKTAAPVLGKPPAGPPRSQTVTGRTERSQTPEVVPNLKSETQTSIESQRSLPHAIRAEEDKFAKPDESDAPYVLVQSKKKREKKKLQQRESENFTRSHVDQTRSQVGRGRRNVTERRKSVGSVPGSENDECSDDDDSVRSLPAGECTPRERIPKPCSSSGGTPQTSYADIARMSRDETVKPPTSAPISAAPQPTAAKPSIAVKPPAPTPVAVSVNSDTNFPALSPKNPVEKTAPVGAAVWPCRQRMDVDPLSKEKLPVNSKSDDAPKEGASQVVSAPPQNSANSIPPTCSSKLLLETKETSEDKTSAEKTSSKDRTPTAAVSENSSTDQGKEAVQIKCNGTVSPSGISVDNDHSVNTTGSKVLGIKKSDDKRAKSIKASEEVMTKPNPKGVVNGDIHSTKPVVFCGGKFDGPNLPVGQEIGFEFGFGVIEALNDNGGLNDSSSAKPKPPSTDFPPISAAPAGKARGNPEQIRSQDHKANHNHDNKVESRAVNKDQVPKPMENQSNKNGPTTKIFQAGDSGGNNEPEERGGGDSTIVIRAIDNKSVVEKNPEPPVVDEKKSAPLAVVEKKSAPSAVVEKKPAPPSVVEKKPESSAVASAQPAQSADPSPNTAGKTTKPSAAQVGDAEGKKHADVVDIAQLYIPPKDVTVPDTVHKSSEFMDKYADRLKTSSKGGSVSYHRV